MRLEARDVEQLSAFDFIAPDQVAGHERIKRRSGGILGFYLCECVHESKKPARTALEIPEVVHDQQKTDEGEARCVGRQIQPTIRL